jgi:predicted O-methyltransferase YrrM
MVPYIGDISKNDARLLAEFAHGSDKILEFGMGASTQVMAEAKRPEARFVSVETDPFWIQRTKDNFEKLGLDLGQVEWTTHDNTPRDDWDFIFVDGVDNLRGIFAEVAWGHLKVGGHMAFHDTRRPHDLQQALVMALKKMGQVEAIAINMWDSNITVLRKREPLLYENWNEVEGREPM